MRYFLFSCFVAIILIGCASESSVNTSDTSTITGISSPTPALTSAPTTTSNPIPTPIFSPPTKTFTPLPTATEKWITPAPIKEIGNVSIPGLIYGWAPPFYGFLDLQKPVPETLNPLTVPESAAGPGLALALSFSDYKGQIAYLHLRSDGKISLWISDLQLKTPEQVWVDTLGLTAYNSADDQISVKWGIKDNYIFIENYPVTTADTTNVVYRLVYSVPTHSIVKLKGACNFLTVSPITHAYAIGCPIENEHFLILEQDGSFWETKTLPPETYESKTYAFSPRADKVVYADLENAVYILDQNETPIRLAIRYPDYWHMDSPLQWSQDGSKVLVFGKDLPEDDPHCVWDNLNGRVHPCWQLFDAITGTRLWWLGQVDHLNAILSPDGLWLAINSIDTKIYPLGSGRKLMVYDTTQLNTGKVIGFRTLYAMQWSR